MSKAKQSNPALRVRSLCRTLDISKNVFYRPSSKLKIRDQVEVKLIKKHFDRAKQRIGIRQLAMVIQREEGMVMNHKKIARLKRSYGLQTRIRVKNKYKQFAKKKSEHESCPNILERNFKNLQPNQVYSTDVTILRYAGKRAYFAAVKDVGTKEIVGASLSHRIDVELTNKAMRKALSRLSPESRSRLLVHSDQGFNFTHSSFRSLLSSNGVLQSMSRKGNCLDNAPIESFFGLFKDHLDLRGCRTLEEVEKKVTRVLHYYNNDRPQVGLKKMPPSEYRRHFS